MAEQRVQFTIGSIFQGEGFKQAQTAVKDINQAVRTSASVIGNLASNVGILDAKYAKAASAVTGLTSALTTGNPVMAAFGVAMTGVSLIISTFNEKLAEQKKRQDELTESLKRMHDQMVKTWSNEQASEMAKFNDNLKSIGDSYDRITNEANQLISAVNKLAATRDQGQNIQMEIDKLLNGREHKGADKQLEDAKADYAMVLKKNADAEERAQEKIDAANKARIDAQGKIEAINLAIYEASAQYEKNAEELNRIGGIDVKIREQLTKDNEAILAKIQNLNAQREAAEESIVKADRDLAQATEEKKNTELQSTLNRLKAEDAITDAHNALAEEAEKERKDKERKAAEEEQAKQKLIDSINKLTEQREKEKKQLEEKLRRELDAEQKKLDAAKAQMGWGRSGGGSSNIRGGQNLTEREQMTSDAWNSSLITRGLIMGTMGNFYNNGGANQIAERLNLQGAQNQQTAYELAKEQALNQGMSLKDAEKAGRDAARQYRNGASSPEANALRRDAEELARLQEKERRGQKLTEREKQRKKDLERQQGAKQEEIERAKQEAQNIKDLPNNIAKMKDNVDKIVKQLEKLGLK